MNRPIPPSVWLTANQRPAQVAALFSAVFFACGGLLALLRSPVTAGISLGLLAAAIVAVGVTLRLWFSPRIYYDRTHLVLRFPDSQVFRIPLEAVECFFMGIAKYERTGGAPRESAAVVVRLADRALEWKQRDLPADYGTWSDGYVLIDGTWCESITETKVLELNRWLLEAKKSPPGVGAAS